MAAQVLSLGSYPGVTLTLGYDDVTGAASLVQGVNTSAHDCFVTIVRLSDGAQASGTLAAGQTSSYSVAGRVALTFAPLPGGGSAWLLTTFVVQTRWPA